MTSHSTPYAEGRINATDADKRAAFEWLREQALGASGTGWRHAAIALQEVGQLERANANLESCWDDQRAVLESDARLAQSAEGSTDIKLSDRIRPNSEAAPWVIGEIRKLERLCAKSHVGDTTMTRLNNAVFVEQWERLCAILGIEQVAKDADYVAAVLHDHNIACLEAKRLGNRIRALRATSALSATASSAGDGIDKHGNLTGWRAAVAKACGNRDPVNPEGVDAAVAAHVKHHVAGFAQSAILPTKVTQRMVDAVNCLEQWSGFTVEDLQELVDAMHATADSCLHHEGPSAEALRVANEVKNATGYQYHENAKLLAAEVLRLKK